MSESTVRFISDATTARHTTIDGVSSLAITLAAVLLALSFHRRWFSSSKISNKSTLIGYYRYIRLENARKHLRSIFKVGCYRSGSNKLRPSKWVSLLMSLFRQQSLLRVGSSLHTVLLATATSTREI